MKPLTKKEIFQKLKKNMPYLKEKYGLERIALFGSFSKGRESGGSHLDFLVELKKPLGFEFISLHDDLQNIFNKKVDLLTPYGLKSIRHKEIIAGIQETLEYVEAK